MIVEAKCVDKAFDSKNAIQYYPNDIVQIDLSDKYQRRLVWLKTLGGRWVFQFDRANSSNTQLRIFFCKECGQPFDKFTELGTHSIESGHNEAKKIVKQTHQDNADDEEEQALALLRAAEEAEEAAKVKAISITGLSGDKPVEVKVGV